MKHTCPTLMFAGLDWHCRQVKLQWCSEESQEYLLAFPCLDPAIAPGTSLLVNDIEVRPVPAGLAGFLVVHDFE